MLDELKRLEFKLSEPGLRRGDDERPSFPLERPPLDEALVAAFASRRSHRKFESAPILLQELGALLSALMQIQPDGHGLSKLRYPSAGSLYPVQTYIWVKPGRVEGLPGGTYYYHPRDHRLVLLRRDATVGGGLHLEPNRPFTDQSAFSLFLIAERQAIEPLYGDFARSFCLLEAGYMGQLLMSEAAAHRIGLCPIEGVHFAEVREHLALGDGHWLVHTLVGGRISEVASFAAVPAGRQEGVYQGSAPPGRRLPGDGPLVEELRRHLETSLPAYMVPPTFVLLTELPLTANGKVDRRALPAPEGTRPDLQAGYVEPGTALERTVAGIFRDLLRVDRVGLHDNFFDLGGHSLLVVRAHQRLREALGREISVVDLFRFPTIATLARHLGQGTVKPTFERVQTLAEQQKAAHARQRQAMERLRRPGGRNNL